MDTYIHVVYIFAMMTHFSYTHFRDDSSVTDVLKSETYKDKKLVFKRRKATTLCNKMVNALIKA
jgi:hypothetical protein